MSIPFEFTAEGPPVSQQASNASRRRWTQDVQSVAKSHWNGSDPTDGPVMVSITYFFANKSIDVDNLPKPILDGMNNLIYVDDSQITDLICRLRGLNSDLSFQSPSNVLLQAMSTRRPFVHILVEDSPDQEVIR